MAADERPALTRQRGALVDAGSYDGLTITGQFVREYYNADAVDAELAVLRQSFANAQKGLDIRDEQILDLMTRAEAVEAERDATLQQLKQAQYFEHEAEQKASRWIKQALAAEAALARLREQVTIAIDDIDHELLTPDDIWAAHITRARDTLLAALLDPSEART